MIFGGFAAFTSMSPEAQLLQSSRYGERASDGGWTADGEPVEVRIRKDPMVGGAVKSVEMKSTGSRELELVLEIFRDKVAGEARERGATLATAVWR